MIYFNSMACSYDVPEKVSVTSSFHTQMCVCACARARARVCVCVCVCLVCMCANAHTRIYHARYIRCRPSEVLLSDEHQMHRNPRPPNMSPEKRDSRQHESAPITRMHKKSNKKQRVSHLQSQKPQRAPHQLTLSQVFFPLQKSNKKQRVFAPPATHAPSAAPYRP
jgi:hypothetical protein